MGLDKSLDVVRGRILATKPLPSLHEAFSEVRREESRRKVMLGKPELPTTIEGSGFVSHNSLQEDIAPVQAYNSRGPSHNPNDNRTRRGRPWCEHCQKPGHIKDTCWKLHGKPADWKPNRRPNERETRGHAAAAIDTKPTPDPFTKDQLDVLQKLFAQATNVQTSPNTVGAGNTIYRGEISLTFASYKTFSNTWIVDSGASDHMTGNKALLSSYEPCHKPINVRVADGSCSKVAGFGTVYLSPELVLHSV